MNGKLYRSQSDTIFCSNQSGSTLLTEIFLCILRVNTELCFFDIYFLLDAVWKKEENQNFHDNRIHILNLMEHLNIIARPVTYSDSEENQDGPATKVDF